MDEIVYHIPALLDECIEGLQIKPDGTYVDVTFGGGGHSRAIMSQLGPEDISTASTKTLTLMPTASTTPDSRLSTAILPICAISCASMVWIR